MSEAEDPEITDGRKTGEFESRYPFGAWLQIVLEFLYLLAVLAMAAAILLLIGYGVATPSPSYSPSVLYFFEYPRHATMLVCIAIASAGVIGGIAFDLKWLYHSVAKGIWSRDRWLWRITVPIQSGLLAVFLAFAIKSGLIPLLNKDAFSNFYTALGFGFLIGYFSDNTIAALQRFARHTLGTQSESPQSSSSASPTPEKPS